MKSKAIGALALLLTASMPAMALEGADVYSQVRSSLVQLVGVGVEGRFYLGSGVALPNGSIVTNCHVTQHAKRLEPFWGNTSTRAESQRADVQHDLCLVQMPGLQVRPTEVASSKGLHVGDKVYAVGFNGGRRLTYEEGEVSELFPLDGGMVIRTTAAFSQGASGGGLFDAEGRLVGIGAEGRFYLGSGVALPNGSIVTNCHVTQHAKYLEPFWGNSSARAESQRADVQYDLCLVQMPGL
jgi:S1-C subfamily serine protease